MDYDITDILRLPDEEQEEISNAIYKHLNFSIIENKPVKEELDTHFVKTESGNYKGHIINEVQEKIAANWQNRSSL